MQEEKEETKVVWLYDSAVMTYRGHSCVSLFAQVKL